MTGDIFMLLLYSAYDIPLVSLQYPNYNDNCKKKTENMVMVFLCTVERHSIIKPVFCIRLKVIIRKSANQMKVWDAKL